MPTARSAWSVGRRCIRCSRFPIIVARRRCPRMRECDRVKDPEDVRDPRTGKRAIDNFESFMKFLAPLARGPITDEARTGEQVFGALGCASCHMPALTTGAHASAALNRQTVA